jgi:uncharacterized protein
MIRWIMNTLVASMIFFPQRELPLKPQDFGLQAEDVRVTTSDGVPLHGWFFEGKQGGNAITFFHGNATNISGLILFAKEWQSRGASVLLIDYRGYGKSEGTIRKGKDLFLDAEASVAWLAAEKNFERADIVLYGQSIGSAPAIELATRYKFKALILEAPFTSLKELAKLHYGFSFGVFLKDFPFENEGKISRIQSPLFIVHGTKDEVCPLDMGKRLFEKALSRKEFFEVPGAQHNDLPAVAGDDFFEKPFRFACA